MENQVERNLGHFQTFFKRIEVLVNEIRVLGHMAILRWIRPSPRPHNHHHDPNLQVK